MPNTRPILRGAQDIRTLSGTGDQTFLPHRTFLRIACLEMEKFRREQERASATRRVENIDRRFSEINTERDRLLRAMGDRAAREEPPKQTPTGPRGISALGAGGFRFRY